MKNSENRILGSITASDRSPGMGVNTGVSDG